MADKEHGVLWPNSGWDGLGCYGRVCTTET